MPPFEKSGKGKWISELTPQTPLDAAARRVLSLRLEGVRDSLELALRQPEEDLEHVHRLRVSTRRASAAVTSFRDCLPRKAYVEVRQTIKSIRSAAGDARDWDVIMERLAGQFKAFDSEACNGLDFLNGFAIAQRVPAQHALMQVCPQFPFDFEQLMGETIAAVRSKQDLSLQEHGRGILANQFAEISVEGIHQHTDADFLHDLRLAGKSVRYTIELFAGCFNPALRETVYPEIMNLQDVLGGINDGFVARGFLSNLREDLQRFLPKNRKRYLTGIDLLLELSGQNDVTLREQFGEWLQRWEGMNMPQLIAEILAMEYDGEQTQALDSHPSAALWQRPAA